MIPSPFVLTAAAALSLALSPALLRADPFATGLGDLAIPASNSGRGLQGFVWYPTTDTAAPTAEHSNPVWAGIMAQVDATPAPGSFPLVVLSHGMFGNAMNQSWLADALARQGYVVAAINHPGTSTWARDPEDARQMWQRPRDISRVIDHMLAGGQVDPDRLYVAGHSLGGFTAVALAGGRFDAARASAFCATRDADPGCDAFALFQVAQTPADMEAMQADLSDPRIRGFAVFDLGGTPFFDPASLGQIDRPMWVWGAPRDIDGTGLTLETEARALAAALPQGRVTYLEPESLSHFDFLGTCTPAALAILAEEEPDDLFVCKEGMAERAAEQSEVVAQILTAFARD